MKIELKNISKVFPPRGKSTDKAVTAVDDFSLEIPDGKLVGLLGPSGCGKSTLLYMLCGLETPTNGQILFGDNDVTKVPPEHRGIGMVFQNYALYPHLTVRQNVMFPLENLKGKDRLSKEEMRKRADDAMELVQIRDFADRKATQLSGGQQQRVAIARALVKLPNVLLLDEPLSNLDARLRIQTREEIRKIQLATKITTVFVTHDQEEALSICDLIVLMKNGIIQQTGRPQDIYDDPDNLFVAEFLGNPQINTFRGRIENNTVFIGSEAVMKLNNAPDAEVFIGIRPEGLIPDPNGVLTCKQETLGVLGRDISVTASHHDCRTSVRAIIDAQHEVNRDAETVKFSIRPNKLFLFDAATEKRLNFNGSERHGFL